jgi:hypothetical protein
MDLVGCCEHGNATASFIKKRANFLYLIDYQMFKDAALWLESESRKTEKLSQW